MIDAIVFGPGNTLFYAYSDEDGEPRLDRLGMHTVRCTGPTQLVGGVDAVITRH